MAEQVRAGDVRAVSRAITTIENHEPEAESCFGCFSRTQARRISRNYWRARDGEEHAGRPAGELSSKETRTSWRDCGDPQAVFRTAPSWAIGFECKGMLAMRERFIARWDARILGGLARATAEVALLLDAAGKKHVLIETVGVGQDEIDIVRLRTACGGACTGSWRRHSEYESRLMEIGDILF